MIASNTKEDSEIWVVDRTSQSSEVVPRKLLQRQKNVTFHVDHVRDFFVGITRQNSKMKLLKCQDNQTEWVDLLPFQDQSLVINEFDAFKDFLAIYCKRNGKPEIVVQDLSMMSLKTIDID